MTEHDFELLRNLLQDSFENNNEKLSCFDYLEDYFSAECGVWRVMYCDSPTTDDMRDFIILKDNFETRFRIELRYRAWRIRTGDPKFKPMATEPGWSYYNLKTCYLSVRKFIQEKIDYSTAQKKTYIVLMASGLLEAITDEPTDSDFYNFFMTSDLAKQAIHDQHMLLDHINGKALCGCYPDMFTADENVTIPDVDSCFDALPPSQPIPAVNNINQDTVDQKTIISNSEDKNNKTTKEYSCDQQTNLSEENILILPKYEKFNEIRKLEEQIKSNNFGADAFKITFWLVTVLLGIGFTFDLKLNFILAFVFSAILAILPALIVSLIASNIEENKLKKHFEGHHLYKEYMDAKNNVFRYLKQQKQYWEQMSGAMFERKVALVLARCGYKDVEITPVANDGGIDIYMKDEQNELIAVQCKRYTNPVGVGEIRDFYGALNKNKISKGIFVCSGGFTSGAAKFCSEVNIEKLELTDIIKMDVSSMGDYDENCIEEFISGMKNMQIVKSFINSQSRKKSR